MPFGRSYSRYSPYARRKMTRTALRGGYSIGRQMVPVRHPRKLGKIRARMALSNPRNVHKFCRWVTTPVDHSLTTNTLGGAGVFQLNDIELPSEFGNLYDRYMITHVQARIQLVTNPDAVLPTNVTSWPGNIYTGANFYPKFWWCPDYDDSSVESLDDLKQRAKTKCIVLQPNRMFLVNLKPAVLVQSYGSVISTGYSPKWRQWVDMENRNVAHYGYKYVIDANGYTPTTPFKIRIEYKYWFTCKDVR